VERARAVDERFSLDTAGEPVAAELCGRLDGLAVAIELAEQRLLAALTSINDELTSRGRSTAAGSADVRMSAAERRGRRRAGRQPLKRTLSCLSSINGPSAMNLIWANVDT